MADRQGGGDGDDELGSTKLLDSLQKEHDKFFDSLRSEGRRLERNMIKDTSENASSGDSQSYHNNPFSLFKQFVDDSFDALASGIAYLPFKIAEWDKRNRGTMEQEEEMWKRWTGSTDLRAYCRTRSMSMSEEGEEAYQTAILLLMEALKKNAHIPLERIQALYRDPESSIADFWGIRKPSPAWLSTDWFRRDPYSPFQLEAQPDLVRDSCRWRVAFEDLVTASLDKPMFSEREHGAQTNPAHLGPGLDWMLGLQSRGVLPPLLPSYYSRPHVEKAPAHQSLLQQLARLHAGSRSFPPSSPLHDDISSLAEQVDCKAAVQLKTPETEQEMYEAWQELQLTRAVDEKQLRQTLHPEFTRTRFDAEKDIQQDASRAHEQSYTHDTAIHGSDGVALQDYLSQLMLLEKQNKRRLLLARQANHGGRSAIDVYDDENDNDDDQLWFAEQKIWDALDDRDVEAAKKVIDDWYDRFGNIEQLFGEHLRKAYDRSPSAPAVDWLPIWNAAVCRSKLPEDDLDKEQARSSEAEAMAAVHYQRGAAEKYRTQLQDRYAQMAGHTASQHWSNEQIEKVLARLELEHENLEQMTGNKKHMPATDTPVTEVDVLSALTTTYTTRLSDGTVTTKAVLKQRFADGREETTESVRTTNKNIESESRARGEKEAKSKKTGWFWS